MWPRVSRGRGGNSGWQADGPIGNVDLSGEAGQALAGLQRAAEWLAAHAAAVTIGSLVGLLVVAALMAVVLWFNARGVFMYVDDVATGRSDVRRPWRQHAAAASSYFSWSLGISLAGIFVLLFAVGLVVAGMLAFASGRVHGSGAWLAAAGMAPVLGLLLLGLVLLALAALALRDFVAPLQLATGLPCGGAARVLEGLVLANPGAFVLYLVLKLVVVVVSGIVDRDRRLPDLLRRLPAHRDADRLPAALLLRAGPGAVPAAPDGPRRRARGWASGGQRWRGACARRLSTG